MKYHEIAEILGVYPITVGKSYRAYNKEGYEAIKIKIRGLRTGACRTLNQEQEKQIKKAKVEKAQINWGDEIGLCNTSQHGRSHAPRGKTPAIRLPAKKERLLR